MEKLSAEFQRGFTEELEKIAWGALALGAIPTAGFAGYDTYKAWKEQMGEGPRSEEMRQKTYLTKYPSVGLIGTALAPQWALGKGLEAIGRRGDTGWHRAASAGAGTIGSLLQIDPGVVVQKAVGL